jgi:hypothetical protein
VLLQIVVLLALTLQEKVVPEEFLPKELVQEHILPELLQQMLHESPESIREVVQKYINLE